MSGAVVEKESPMTGAQLEHLSRRSSTSPQWRDAETAPPSPQDQP